MSKRIFVFGEDPAFGVLLQRDLARERAFTFVGWCQKFEDLKRSLRKTKPGILLIEIPKGVGPPGIRGIKHSFGLDIVVVATGNDERAIHQAIKWGADGYLIRNIRNSNWHEIILALNQAAIGGVALSSFAAKSLISTFWKKTSSLLTRAETKVLEHISQGYSGTRVAKNLEISKETVKTHTKNIYRKLNVHRKSEALEWGYTRQLFCQADEYMEPAGENRKLAVYKQNHAIHK